MDNKQYIHIGAEIVAIIAVIYYVRSQTTSINGSLQTLEEKVATYETTIAQQSDTISKLQNHCVQLTTEFNKLHETVQNMLRVNTQQPKASTRRSVVKQQKTQKVQPKFEPVVEEYDESNFLDKQIADELEELQKEIGESDSDTDDVSDIEIDLKKQPQRKK